MSSSQKEAIKIVIVGDGMVGKTSLLMAFKDNVFTEGYIPTVFDNYEVEKYIDGQLLVLSLWDTAGQESFDRIRLLSYSNTDAFVLCFDVARTDSFEHITNKWIPELRYHCGNPCILLVGTKSDLREDQALSGQKLVTEDEAKSLCDRINAAKYIECSARIGNNVDEVFEEAARLSLRMKEVWIRRNECCLLI